MKYKNLIFKVLIPGLVILLINSNVFGLICHNGAGTVYQEGGGGESVVAENIVIEYYIIEGGGYYLDANSAVQQLLGMVERRETAGIDYRKLRQVVDGALLYIKNAMTTYDQLIRKAEATPYNETVIAHLAAFDYADFMVDNRFKPSVFKEVEEYLQSGDITGVFKKTYAHFKSIYSLLEAIKEQANQNKLPATSTFWELNETLSETSLFGSYVARVLPRIKINESNQENQDEI